MEIKNVYLLKGKHLYDDEFEELGVFTSKEEMEKGKERYLEKMKPVESDRYRFTWTTLTLNELY